MKIYTNKTDTYSSTEGTIFKFSDSPTIFNILSDNLYSNKIGSIVRELSCNARDSHVSAGKGDVPFDITMEEVSSFFIESENLFRVRDYGVGLSEDDIYNLYSVYGLSNKSDSNEYIGGFGIGSKSPFAYTNSFVVTSWYDGKKKVYCAFKNSDGYPEITKLSDTISDEPSGVEISIPIRKCDVPTFVSEVKTQLAYFKVKPNTNFTIDLYFNNIVSELDNGYFLTNTSSFVIIGEIAYKIDTNHISKKFEYMKNKCGQYLGFYLNIGEVDISASRESLSYTERTIKVIEKKYNDFFDYFIQKMSSFTSSSKWDYMYEYNRMYFKFYNDDSNKYTDEKFMSIKNKYHTYEKLISAQIIDDYYIKAYIVDDFDVTRYKSVYGIANKPVYVIKNLKSVAKNVKKINVRKPYMLIIYKNVDELNTYINNIGNPSYTELEPIVDTSTRNYVNNKDDISIVYSSWKYYKKEICFDIQNKKTIKITDFVSLVSKDNFVFVPITKYELCDSLNTHVISSMLYYLRDKCSVFVYGIQKKYAKLISEYVPDFSFDSDVISRNIAKKFLEFLNKENSNWMEISEYYKNWEKFDDIKKYLIDNRDRFTEYEYKVIVEKLPFMKIDTSNVDKLAIEMSCLYREYVDDSYNKSKNELSNKLIDRYPFLYYMIGYNNYNTDMFVKTIRTYLFNGRN